MSDDALVFSVSEELQKLTEQWRKQSEELQLRLQQTLVVSPIFSELGISAEAAKQFRAIFDSVVIEPPQFRFIAANIAIPEVLSPEFRKEMEHLGEQMADLVRQCAQGAERLGRVGWTLPVEMSPGEMLEVLRESDEDAIDRYFVAFYHDGNEIPLLKRTLLGSQHLAGWRPLLEQCFENYEADRYVICIPALLTILEGSIQFPVRGRERIDFLQQQITNARPNSLNQVMWVSINALLDEMYRSADFTSSAPPAKLNRHWILHGRLLAKDWKKADALRLFHALSTVCSIFRRTHAY